MKKLYHCFHVSSYKGGELHSSLNQTVDDIASDIVNYINWDEISDYCVDNEKFSSISDEEFFSLTRVQLLDGLDDKTLKDIADSKIYPGNTYAFDSYSDYEIYTISKGRLKEVNITEEPGFIEALRKYLHEDAEWLDDYDKNHKSEED